jgi:hypothetical protein
MYRRGRRELPKPSYDPFAPRVRWRWLIGGCAALAVAGPVVAAAYYYAFPSSASVLGELPEREPAPIVAPEASGGDSEALRRAIARASFEGPLLELFPRGDAAVYGIATDGDRAIPLWRALRRMTSDTGYYPVILGDGGSLDRIREVLESSEPPDAILARASELDAQAWLAQRSAALERDWETPHGEWSEPDGEELPYTIPTDILSGRPLAHVAIALVPTTRAWEVPAWLGYGGWNDCPEPAVQVAVMKRWHERYGAEVVGMSEDVVEMRVARPPRTRAASMELAGEHYAYCYDIVLSGTGSIEGLASGVLGRGVWFFWWD